MSDEFLGRLTADVSAIERRARELFGGLNYERFNWSSQPDRWSVGKCLEHLVIANEPYFAIFSSVAKGTKQTTFWERVPFLPKMFGTAVLNTVRPETAKKSKAPGIFRPTVGNVPLEMLDTFCAQQQRLVETFASLKGVDVDKTIVTSPVARFIPYSLRDALLIVVEHEKRHMNQAERMLRNRNDGPGNLPPASLA